MPVPDARWLVSHLPPVPSGYRLLHVLLLVLGVRQLRFCASEGCCQLVIGSRRGRPLAQARRSAIFRASATRDRFVFMIKAPLTLVVKIGVLRSCADLIFGFLPWEALCVRAVEPHLKIAHFNIFRVLLRPPLLTPSSQHVPATAPLKLRFIYSNFWGATKRNLKKLVFERAVVYLY